MKKQILNTVEDFLLLNREVLTAEEIADLEKQIAYLKEEIRKDAAREYIDQLKVFQSHMSITFEVLMGDHGTDETCSNFYNSDFEITWRGKTVKLYNGAEVFQGIESVIAFEIDNEEI